MKVKLWIVLVLLTFLTSCGILKIGKKPTLPETIKNFEEAFKNNRFTFAKYPEIKIDTINTDIANRKIEINFDKNFSYIPFRQKNVDSIYNEINNFFKDYKKEFRISVKTIGFPIEELIPNYYRKNKLKFDTSRLPKVKHAKRTPLVTNLEHGYIAVNGLYNKNIALWPSHGWYYNFEQDRWMWQRARLFGTVEDLGPMAFTIPYLIPMLENAGANVFVPRERDTQTHEVVVDNDSKSDSYIESSFDKLHKWKTGSGKAFNYGHPPYPANYNPFEYGTHRIVASDKKISAQVEFVPRLPIDGYYAVYISYNSSLMNAKDAHYTVFHSGGKTDFVVNQTIGGNTWIYLGRFKFKKGINPKTGKVVLTNQSSESGKIVSADAVRFGGGMGIISRDGKTSGRPKFVEGARYYLQYLGMPDTLVYNLNGNKNDYKDDYQSRGEYVNYLKGKPFGPNKNRNVKGLGIPIDLSLAFHTDAGITKNDTTVGTLAIYSIEDIDSSKVFPDSVSRLANRDFADILQTQITTDIRRKYDPVWNRRELKNAFYSEAARPNVPAALLELLSHQNFLDVQFMLDPRFRFDVSRSIYKAMLKFLSVQYNYKYVVQPLPPTHFATEFISDRKVKLIWKPEKDDFEPTAVAKSYKVYTRINDGGFDNGVPADSTFFIKENLRPGVIYSFKVTAINEGGESFPSEILAVSWVNNKKPVLIVNGFDRIAPPAKVGTNKFAGFLDFIDSGEPDKVDIGYTGMQHDFNPGSKWKTDDIPGYGASYANYETDVIAGNTFDFPFVHGKSILKAGYSFVSCSDEAVMDSLIDMRNYFMVDLILGEEKTTHWQKPYADSLWGVQFKTFPAKLEKRINEFLNSNGNIFISGAYVASDLFLNNDNNLNDMNFAKFFLKYKLDADHAVKKGNVVSTGNGLLPDGFNFSFNTSLNDSIYAVEAPDAIAPVNGGVTVLRYSENLFSAGTAYLGDYGVVAFGFPFETIKGQIKRDAIMKYVLNYFGM